MKTDANGAFELGGLPRGTVELKARGPGGGAVYHEDGYVEVESGSTDVRIQLGRMVIVGFLLVDADTGRSVVTERLDLLQRRGDGEFRTYFTTPYGSPPQASD